MGLILLSTLSAAFHHHADGGDHHDCPICVASLHHSPADLCTASVQAIHLDLGRTEFFTPSVRIIEAFFPSFTIRAPPA